MAELDDNYNHWDLESDEYRMPGQVIKNYNSHHNEPQPVSNYIYTMLKNQTVQLKIRVDPLTLKIIILMLHLQQITIYSIIQFTEKPKCTPLVKKVIIEFEEEEPRKMGTPSSHEAISLQTPKSMRSQQPHKTKAAEKIRARLSKPQILSKNQIRQKQLQRFIDGWGFSLLMALVTIYALFGDDIRILSVNKDGDDIFFILTSVCIACFTIEIVLTCIVNPAYLFNFYFWLDLISTATMILDIGWLTDHWYGDEGDVQNAATLKALGKASRTARKAARVIRIIRLVRLIKLYKHARQQIEKEKQKSILQELLLKDEQKLNSSQQQHQQQQNKQKQNYLIRISVLQQNKKKHKAGDLNSQLPYINKSKNSRSQSEHDQNSSNNEQLKQSTHSQSDQIQESHVGSQLQDLVMRRAITIIISILISIPILTLDTYSEIINSYDSGILRISQFRKNLPITDMLIQQYVQFHNHEIYPIQSVLVLQDDLNQIYTEYNYTKNPEWFQSTEMVKSQYRFSDQQYFVTTDANNQLITYSVSDLVDYNKINAILSIFQTVFVCIVLALSAILFNKDVTELIIEPIETMIQKIELIANNPLEAVNIEEQEDLITQEQIEQTTETYLLQELIMKIGALLAVGFGEAGSEIIAENIKKGGSVDPMIPGKRVLAIFGFCDIRNFTDATEVLQEDVMVFVNEIAEIVHFTVDTYGGSVNKNIGDAFLLVWKYPDMKYHVDPQTNKGDMAVLSFLKIIISVSLSKKLEKYKRHEGLNSRIKDYCVRMGFGLHLGWGIEGAIGSSFKIDVSYLSPNVNMASRLEAATKQFGTYILISGVLKRNLTQACQNHIRLIDVVTVKGSIEPVELYTVDLSIKNLLNKFKEPRDIFDISRMKPREQKQFRVVNRYKRNLLIRSVEDDKIQLATLFEKDEDLIAARELYTQEFYDTWISGFNSYIRGEWDEAQKIFMKTLNMIPEHKDGPSNTLLEVINSAGGRAPYDWKGFRELTEK
ncbi:unnamed protein product (macronuclear) [Paramecium tetraurelia]|uniref:Guanylate cyclase domain-containing protein n=1 Tax=Paramecium tetraurelia TaxID=5888 RepID=A0DTW5_PARTE|nr:uncharacterized protein GSPATT00020165001 [Paramecium tetraurelia]CAK86482.1 unnamed protein product [Paramecium tetraurelia]|eukprot:XP_001453879.1 hypothetical protein (macronuclear) [Paramecium tetraurelia strain d4-2]